MPIRQILLLETDPLLGTFIQPHLSTTTRALCLQHHIMHLLKMHITGDICSWSSGTVVETLIQSVLYPTPLRVGIHRFSTRGKFNTTRCLVMATNHPSSVLLAVYYLLTFLLHTSAAVHKYIAVYLSIPKHIRINFRPKAAATRGIPLEHTKSRPLMALGFGAI
jgi:hypothetical protein